MGATTTNEVGTNIRIVHVYANARQYTSSVSRLLFVSPRARQMHFIRRITAV